MHEQWSLGIAGGLVQDLQLPESVYDQVSSIKCLMFAQNPKYLKSSLD
jgi:hypothetical protein